MTVQTTTNKAIVDGRAVDAMLAALKLGFELEDAFVFAMRAKREAISGISNDTLSFAGSVSIGHDASGKAVLRVQTYTGKYVDPMASGQDGASTDD